MLKTQRLIVACLTLATGLGLGFLFAALFTFDTADIPPPIPLTDTATNSERAIYTALQQSLEMKGIKTEGLSPYLLLEHFPPIEEIDFDGVEAIIGKYAVRDGVLSYETGEAVETAAASDMSEAGFSLFLKNYSARTGLAIQNTETEDIVAHMGGHQVQSPEESSSEDSEYVACTMDAKMCPDGSYVGRSGPHCEFAACPSSNATPKAVTCTAEQKAAEACIEIYQPVCASVRVECVTTPCEPVRETFGNSCQACSEERVTEYTEGECAIR